MNASDLKLHVAVTHWTVARVLLLLLLVLMGLSGVAVSSYRTGRSAIARASQRTIDSLQIVLLDARLSANEAFLNRVAECIAVTTPASDEDGGPWNGEHRRRP